MRFKLLFLLLLFFTLQTSAQTDTQRNRPAALQKDSLLQTDSAMQRDSVLQSRSILKNNAVVLQKPIARPAIKTLGWRQDTLYTKLYKNLYPGKNKTIFLINAAHQPDDKDLLFYMLAGVLLLVGFVRSVFPKYFQNVLRLFFQSAYRQKQSKDQVLQYNLPSLLLNIAFVLSGGLLAALLVNNSPQAVQLPLWLLWLYACGALAVIYLGKYLFIAFCGWAFNAPQFAFNYNFIVFLVNKTTGIFLLPLLLLLAFSDGQIYTIAVTAALTLVLLMLAYRYIVALSAVVKNLKVNAVHFFIYLCAVEILPLLIIYKLLFIAIR